MLVKTFGSTVQGIDAITITIEVDVSHGFRFILVGLPDNVVKESQQRIEASLRNYGIKWPHKKVIINMAPADIRKEGAAFDLPMAIGILAAQDLINNTELHQYIMMGELSLDGKLKPVKGILPIAIKAREEHFKGLIVPKENSLEAAVVEGLDIYGLNNLEEVIQFLNKEQTFTPVTIDIKKEFSQASQIFPFDFSDVKGQENVKRALEVAAAGGHNVIMVGPPGAGKSMLAKRLPSILPPLTIDEALETTKIHSVAGKTSNNGGLIHNRPFRSPHHTISDVALVGGGSYPQPGEISLSHNGVLFLDELPEFKRTVLEVMRQPLEDRCISISRARFSVDYPASFMLIASMNPCPCGYHNHPEKKCICAPGAVHKYLGKISGPLLDRIDIQIEVIPVSFDKLASQRPSESSKDIRNRVVQAREIQAQRFKNTPGIHCNAQMTSSMLRKYSKLDESAHQVLKSAMQRLNFSARAYDRILKVARTIADLEAKPQIEAFHLSEAIQYRNLDRADWAN